MDKAEARASQALQAAGYRYLVSGGPGVHHLYSQKGVYSRLGVYITHTSIILIFMGALIGAFFGYKGVVNIQEGERLDKVYVRNEPLWDKIMAAVGVGMRKVAFDPQFNGPAMHLGFSIQCDDFEVDYYENQGILTGMPKEYYSILSVFDPAGRPIIKHRRIEVNAPLTYRGMTFYQSSYGMIPGAAGKIVGPRVDAPGARRRQPARRRSRCAPRGGDDLPPGPTRRPAGGEARRRGADQHADGPGGGDPDRRRGAEGRPGDENRRPPTRTEAGGIGAVPPPRGAALLGRRLRHARRAGPPCARGRSPRGEGDRPHLPLEARPDGKLQPRYRLLGLFPVDLGEYGFLGVSRKTVAGRDILAASAGAVEALVGERVIPAPIPEAWRRRVGRYECVNAGDDVRVYDRVSLQEKDGMLLVDFSLPDANTM